MKSGAIHHPKFRKLKKALDLSTYAAAGILESIWQFAAEYAVDGDLSRFPLDEIADWIEWDSSPSALFDALVETRWLDRDEDGLRIHDWEDHCPDFVKKRITRRKTKDLGHETADNGGQRRTTADNGGQRRRCLPTTTNTKTQPNPTQPNPTDTQPDSPEPSPDGEAAVLVECEAAEHEALPDGFDEPPDTYDPQPMTDFVFPCTGKGDRTWRMPVSLLEIFIDAYPGVDVEKAIRAALAWCHANPLKQKTPKGMPRFLNSWIERNQNNSRAGPAMRTAANGPGQVHPNDQRRAEGVL